MRYMRDYIVPCGIADRPVTSLAEEGIDVDDARRRRHRRPARGRRRGVAAPIERQDVAWKHRPDDLSPFSRGRGAGAPVRTAADHGVRASGRFAWSAGCSRQVSQGGLTIGARKPEWLRPKVVARARGAGAEEHGPRPRPGHRVRGSRLPEPERLLGRRHGDVHGARRALHARVRLLPGRHAQAAGADADEPARVAEAIDRDGSRPRGAHDGGPRRSGRRRLGTRRCVRRRDPRSVGPARASRRWSSDAKGVDRTRCSCCSTPAPTCSTTTSRPSPGCSAPCGRRPVTRAAWACWPGPSRAGLTVKSGLIVGIGETADEVEGCLVDLASIGVDIVTIGQYLRPTTHHLPVARWVEPHEFAAWAAVRRGRRHRPRRGQPADPDQLPRPAGRRRHRAPVAVSLRDPFVR